MGEDKAFLAVDGRLLIQRVLDVVGPLAADVIIVTNSPEDYVDYSARLVRDVRSGTGALGGIYTGLLEAQNPLSLVVACDMPFLNADLLQYMVSLARRHDVVMPYAGEEEPPANTHTTAKARDLHPLHAVYSKRCIEPIQRALDRGDLRTVAFLPEVDARFVGRREIEEFDPRHRSFFNANTPEQLRRARELSETYSGAG